VKAEQFPKPLSCHFYKKNALSYGGASSTVGDAVLLERNAITTDCFTFKKYPQISVDFARNIVS